MRKCSMIYDGMVVTTLTTVFMGKYRIMYDWMLMCTGSTGKCSMICNWMLVFYGKVQCGI